MQQSSLHKSAGVARYRRSLVVPPTALVINGRMQFGCFNAALPEVNLLDAKRPYQFPIPTVLKKLQLREWQAIQAFNGRYFIMSAIYQARKMALVQFIIYDTQEQKKWRYELKVPPWQMQVGKGLQSSDSSFEGQKFSINIKNRLESGEILLNAQSTGLASLPTLRASLRGDHSKGNCAPAVVSLPFGPAESSNRGMYAHKVMMAASGNIELDGKLIPFDHGTMILDDHKGYYPWPTKYDWGTAMGVVDDAGTRLGFNFTDNQVIDQERFNENVLWVDNKVHPLPPVSFERPKGHSGPWHIRDQYGMVSLDFEPIIQNDVNVNLILFASRYKGPYGYFTGEITNSEGTTFKIDRLFGMGEDFYLRI